ncbi:prostaglandin E2 receptor EP4 subtype-like [Gigantopelta aegis]|uniref:prostaglandin E2 receptor EP4 subtype-like n=1 Tax=Gigantopelta aegis TaxID=1735272 RepID=UPI001B88BD6F|nr:prostaglandin E2 receptor EP4 subtype-like [Gigantopelta aegis]
MVSTEQYPMGEENTYHFSVNESGTVFDYNITVGQPTLDVAKKNHTVMVSCIMFGSGVFGNLLALTVLATSAPEQRRTLFYKLVAGLAISDLLGTVATSPVVISVYINNFKWVGGLPLCHYFSFMMIFASFTTMFIVCAMSVERFICVRHPYLYHTRLTATYAKISLLGSWAISLVMASLPLMGLGKNTFQYPRTWCFFDYTSREPLNMVFNILYASIAMITIVVTMCCNLVVTYTLLRLRRKQGLLNALNGTASGKYKNNNKRYAELQMVVLLIGITIVFTCCYSPLMIYVFLCQTSLVTLFNTDKAMLLMVRFASFNQILDPWVYILFRRELVWKVVHAVKFLLRIENSQDNLDLTRVKKLDDDSCCAFCLHCLCEPPAKGGNFYASRPSMSYTRSPSYIRRLSGESIYGNGNVSSKLIIKPPSPQDAFVLKNFTPVEQPNT